MQGHAYNLSDELLRCCRRLSTINALSHIDPQRVLFGISPSRRSDRRARTRGLHGVFAACHALRFEGGRQELVRGSTAWRWPRCVVHGVEQLYYITFFVPRFLDLPPEEKVKTVVHELFHISPAFDGDLRRFGRGARAFHGLSLKHYEAMIAPIVDEAHQVLGKGEFAFIEYSHAELLANFGAIVGRRAKRLRPRRVTADDAAIGA